MTKGHTSKLEAQKKKKKGAASTQQRQRALPAGWIQGDFLPSSVMENDVLELVEHGMEWTNWHSAVSNGNPVEEEEGSQEGSADSAEYVSHSGETEEEDEESGEQSSSPSPPEHRTKRRDDPAAPPASPAAPSAPPAPPVAPSARSVKRTRGASAEPVNHPSKVAKPSRPKPRKALPRMRIVVPVALAAATSATSLPRQGDDPMDIDNAATSQQVGLPSEVIHLDDDDQRRSAPALAPVSGVTQPAANPVMNVPPTETVALTAEPTGAELGMPREPSAAPGPSTVQYDARRLPEDQKTCEMGSAYNALKAEKTQLATDLEVVVNDLAGVKKALADRVKSLEESREANKALLAEISVGTLRLKRPKLNGRLFRMFHSAMKLTGTCSECILALRVVGRSDKELWPENDSRNEIQGLMTRLEDVPSGVRAWKKSAAQCGVDVALSLVRVHWKEAREDKLKTLQVTNTKKL
ncbi:hypothetical protein ZWY2020_035913 [Hordeum vulgare]|nr:hypothetical protein ZWY2020_035913 [Hordeum vulgare]